MLNFQDSPQHVNYSTAAIFFNIALQQLLSDAYENDRQKVDDLFFVILTLCPFAFCAYNDANPNHGWTEYMQDGCIVQHLSWECLRVHVEGVLRIQLEKAQNLPANAYGRRGRYIVFSAGSSRVGSTDDWDESNPIWNSTHHLLIKKNYQEGEHYSKLHIELHNSETRKFKTEQQRRFHKSKRKKYLGSVTIALSEVLKDEASTHTPHLELRDSRSTDQHTVVTFQAKRSSLDDVWNEDLKATRPADAWEQQMPKSKKNCNWEFLNKENVGDFKAIGFINAVMRGTQLWIYADQSTKTIAVAFRGTEKTKWEDVRTVFQLQPSTLHWEKTGSCNLETTLDPKNKKMKFHAGFVKAYNAIRIALLEFVYRITEWSEEWTICLTGHSLGGALAVLCSFDYAHLTDQEGKRPEVFMMSFGAPRVGNRAFKKTYKEAVKHRYRVACGKDIICTLPIHFRHVGKELRFERCGSVVFNKNPIANVVGEAQYIENKMKKAVIQRWHSQVKRKRSISHQTTMRDRKMEDISLAQEETPRKPLIRSDTSMRRDVELIKKKVASRGTSHKSFLSVASFKLEQLRLLENKCRTPSLPGLKDHSENCYFRFSNYVTRCLKYSRRYMHQNRHRSSEQFMNLVGQIQNKLAQQQGNNCADQPHEEHKEAGSV